MPSSKTHIFIGLILSITLMFVLKVDYKLIPLILVVTIIYSQLPDIDSRASKIRHWFYIILFLVILYFSLIDKNLLYAGVCSIAGLFVVWKLKHRSKKELVNTHSYFIGLILSVIPLVFNVYLGVFAFVSYSLHLFLDGLFTRKR